MSIAAEAGKRTRFEPVCLSLKDLVGEEYVASACAGRAFLTGESEADLLKAASETVEFFPEGLHDRLVSLLPRLGDVCCPPMESSAAGATSDGFRANSAQGSAPRSCLGYLRVGEDGRLAFSSKSAHYHVPLGHSFPGNALVECAKRIGIPNATHNNTRGHITRLAEEELICRAAGISHDDVAARESLLVSSELNVLNRVLNLSTGSLAAEAALKMVLGRFHKPQDDSGEPKYTGRTPVILVMGDDNGGITANYHGTTVLTQVMRGMWPDLRRVLEDSGALLVRSVRRDNIEELEALFKEYESGSYKIAGVFHELILMNYAVFRLSDAFVHRLYELCEQHDVPTVVDEIQTCIWSPETFMFREYGVKPSAVVVGKGFPNGEYASSRVLFSAALDNLPQFGALVTNGQEELASLVYLITLRWAKANSEVIRAVGDYYEERLNDLRTQFPQHVEAILGRRHLAGVYFKELEAAHSFVNYLKSKGMDISVQAYKEGCPPSALTKIPLIAGYEAVDFVVSRMQEALAQL